MDKKTLITAAMEARKMAWAPYSNFMVGAAVLCENGNLYTGCNIENAAYGPTICAERTAMFKAVSAGERTFVALAVVGGPRERANNFGYAYPCGVCRQVLAEFCRPNFEILVARSETEFKSFTLEQLLPKSFSSRDLKNTDPTKGIVKSDFGKLYN